MTIQEYAAELLQAREAIAKLAGECSEAYDRIAQLENPWIPVEKKLPMPHLYVLCCCEYNNSVRIPYVSYHDGDEWGCSYKVTHWAYLPKLPDWEEWGKEGR